MPFICDELTPAIPGNSIFIDPSELQAFRPTYRLLSYVLNKRGYTIAADLPGEDQPDTVQILMRDVFNWAGIKPN